MFFNAVRLEVSSATRSTCFGPIHDFLDSICLHGVHKPPPPSKFFYPCLFLPILEDRQVSGVDSIVDLLHDTRDAPEDYCPVLESRASRSKTPLRWCRLQLPREAAITETTLPDPSISPGRCVRSSFVKFLQVVTPADV